MSNIQIIQDWVNGTNFRPTSINFITAKSDIDNQRENTPIGEFYTDFNGTRWKRLGKTTWSKDTPILDAIKASNPTCTACGKEIVINDKLDTKTHIATGMCFDCTIEADTKRRLDGTYVAYEQKFVLTKQRDYVTDMLNQLKSSLKHIDDEKFEFINSFGDIEKWGIDKNKLIEDLTKDIAEGEVVLEKINTELNLLNG